jgi:hypothetical protein
VLFPPTPPHHQSKAQGGLKEMASTPRRSPRTSPYPDRARRTPERLASSPSSHIVELARHDQQASTGPASRSPANAAPHPVQLTLTFDSNEPDDQAFTRVPLYKLLVQPIIKSTKAGRDDNGTILNDFVVTGDSFHEIIHSLWSKYIWRVKGCAVESDEGGPSPCHRRMGEGDAV